MRRAGVHVVERAKEVPGYQEGSLTTNELIAELRTVQDAFKWQLMKHRIRGVLKSDIPGSRVFDPITAVALFRNGRFFPEGHWTEAARAMGLANTDCAEIIAACNYDWDPACRQGVLRHEFMNALILEPDAAKTVSTTPLLTDIFGRNQRKRSLPTN